MVLTFELGTMLYSATGTPLSTCKPDLRDPCPSKHFALSLVCRPAELQFYYSTLIANLSTGHQVELDFSSSTNKASV